MSMDSDVGPVGTPASTSDHSFKWFASEPGKIITGHPALAPFARWLQHLWFYGSLEPSGPVPAYREGVDEATGICVDYAGAALPIPSSPSAAFPPMYTPVASTSTSPHPYPSTSTFPSTSHDPRATLLLEYIGVVQLHFFVPPALLSLLHPPHLTANTFLTVRIPSFSWRELQFTKLDVFCALCREISSASVGHEAQDDWLIYRTLGVLRAKFWKELRGMMENVPFRAVDIASGWEEEDVEGVKRGKAGKRPRKCRSRRLYCYDPKEVIYDTYMHSFSGPEHRPQRAGANTTPPQSNATDGDGGSCGGLILHQRDPDGCELGVAIWMTGETSLIPSHTTLFRFPQSWPAFHGIPDPPLPLPPPPYSPPPLSGPPRTFPRAVLSPPPPVPRGVALRTSMLVMDETRMLEETVDAVQRCLFQDYPS